MSFMLYDLWLRVQNPFINENAFITGYFFYPFWFHIKETKANLDDLISYFFPICMNLAKLNVSVSEYRPA